MTYEDEDDGLEADEVNQSEAEVTTEAEDEDEIETEYDYENESETPDHYDEEGNLKPENYYEANGYHYATDESGRIISCAGRIEMGDAKRNSKAQLEAGGEDREYDANGKSLDDGGHLIARQFGGSGEKDNLVAMDRTLNQVEYKAMENKWADEVKNGNQVDVEIYVDYDKDSKRPSGINAFYTITDKETGEKESYREQFDN